MPVNALEWGAELLREHVACSYGHDSGPVVNSMLHYMGLRPGNPWCATFVSWCFHKALVMAGAADVDPSFKSASSQEIKHYFERLGLLSTDPQKLLEWKGAAGGWTDADGVHGHIFLVGRRFVDASGRVTAIGTIEGNSDSTPDNAVNALRRVAPVTREGHYLWFLNTSELVGGAWWQA